MQQKEGPQVVSTQPQGRRALTEVSWQDINESGAYVERGSGDLYRIPAEALVPGASPVIHKQSSGASRLVQISRNPYILTLEARLLCAEFNIQPNF